MFNCFIAKNPILLKKYCVTITVILFVKEGGEKFIMSDVENGKSQGAWDMEEALEQLGKFKTLDELKAYLGPLTEEEQAILNDPHLYDDPTPEELARFGPDFTNRVIELTMKRIEAEKGGSAKPKE